MAPVRHPTEPSAHDGGREDHELLRDHLRGDSTAFEHLIRRHQDRMWAVAVRTLGDRDQAKDAVQDALVKAYRGAAAFRGDAAVGTWLHRITVNASLDLIRRRRPSVELTEESLPSPDQSLEQVELRAWLDAALRALSPEHRLAVVLVDVEGLPVAEAAELLRVPIGTLKSRCSRGRAALARALGDAAPGPTVVPAAESDPTRATNAPADSSKGRVSDRGGES
jgi:RNA polymerase sigma-70 factor (ECF subfamily)